VTSAQILIVFERSQLKIRYPAHHILSGFSNEKTVRRVNKSTGVATILRLGAVANARVSFAGCVSP
jgi:hypothetical protein